MGKYDERIARLRERKLRQTKEKIEKEGLLDEDDYGRIVPPPGLWKPIPNASDGSFYGYEAWTDNFCSLMAVHPVYIDPDDAFAGRWMYFMSKMRPCKWNPAYPYDELLDDIKKYDIVCGIGDDAHFAPDFRIGLALGWGGLARKVEDCRQNHPGKESFYDIHLRAIRAIQGWILRHIEAARAQGLEDMAQVNENILEAPPTTLREALQWIIWYHLASRTYNRDGAGGQIDALLRPYYEADLKEGRTDRETAVYHLACFLINDPVYWQLGGPDRDGRDQTSEISFLILEAADKINTSLNITIRVHDAMDERLLTEGVRLLVKNKNGWPRFSGDKALVEGFMKNGYSAELARERIAVGCNWMSLPGLEYTMNDLVKVNMAKVFEVAYREMEDPGLDTLWEGFRHHLARAVHTAAQGIRHHLNFQRFNEPELLLNLLSHGPLEKGLDAADGGARYYNLAIDGAGLAIVADSFAAIEEHIGNELDWKRLTTALDDDFQSDDSAAVREILRHTGRFGRENSTGEKWAIRVKELFSDLVRQESEPGYLFIPGLFSWANTVAFGQTVGATPDGRHAGKPISHGANPSPGFVKEGASLSLAKAVAKIQPGYGNTAPMQWEIDPFLAQEDHIDIIKAIIRTHFQLGGTLINVNVMDKQKVLEAHKDPSKYPDLVVRVTGFTAYFAMLSPQFRQLVVDRILES